MKAIDFTNGSWGHCLHAHTWCDVKDHGSWLSRSWDRIKHRRRYSVMVHSRSDIRTGYKIKIKTQGGIKEPIIYDYKWCVDPSDMYTLYLIFDDNPKGD